MGDKEFKLGDSVKVVAENNDNLNNGRVGTVVQTYGISFVDVCFQDTELWLFNNDELELVS